MIHLNQGVYSWILRGSEGILTLFGTVICIGVSIEFASRQLDELWPTPGLYLLEIMIVALLNLTSQVTKFKPLDTENRMISWMTGGVLLAFVILGGFSIGPYFFPAMIAFWLAAAIGDARQKQPILPHLVFTLIVGVLQAALIGILLIIPNPTTGMFAWLC